MYKRNLDIFLTELSDYLKTEQLGLNFSELTERPNMIDEIEAAVKDEDFFETKKFESIYDFRLYRIALYLIVRSCKPQNIIETGVLHGLTTQFLLSALEKNKFGYLSSIDMPSYHGQPPANNDGFNSTLPPRKEPGWLIDKKYLPKWQLYLGKSIDLLPEVFSKLNEVDMFIHDSEHTYSTMIYELNYAWERLTNKGVLICDNINQNTSFFDLCRRINKIPFICPYDVDDLNLGIRFGILRND